MSFLFIYIFVLFSFCLYQFLCFCAQFEFVCQSNSITNNVFFNQKFLWVKIDLFWKRTNEGVLSNHKLTDTIGHIMVLWHFHCLYRVILPYIRSDSCSRVRQLPVNRGRDYIFICRAQGASSYQRHEMTVPIPLDEDYVWRYVSSL